MASEKTRVIDHLWDMLQSEGKGRRIVYRKDVAEAISECEKNIGTSLSVGNPANFMKDIVRGDKASLHWPERLTEMRIGGVQRAGAMRVFEFVQFEKGQTEAFPNPWMPHEKLIPLPVESVSLGLVSKSLGRKDESWLIQVVVNLRIVAHHFATKSPLRVLEINHLQIGVKLGNSEIDSLFLATIEVDGQKKYALVTCEAKQSGQSIIEHQIIGQIVAARKSTKRNMDISLIVPMAVKAIEPNGLVYIVEFKAWTPDEAEKAEHELGQLEMVAESLYRLMPPVQGVGYASSRPKTKTPKPKAK
jgi:hypothetical protein